MASDKAPDPDGLPSVFFQQFWPEVGEDVTKFVQEFLNRRGPIKEINKTLICLSPKTRGAEWVKDF